MNAGRQGRAGNGEASERLYEPLDFFVVRAPLLPVDAFDALDDEDPSLALSHEVRTALAVGSLSYSDALAAGALATHNRRSERGQALRRYLIRMSTRPTPFGLFAGVGMGTWGRHTDLVLATGRRPQRTRADASWLMAIVERAESDPQIRRQLRVVANGAAFVRADRVVLAERVSRGESAVPPAVSIRATSVVRRALLAARTPIPYADLASHLLDHTPGATIEKVETLLAELCEQTLLLTDLRPPVTVDSPAQYVLQRLAPVREAIDARESLQSVVDAAADWDAAPAPDESRFRAIVKKAAAVAPFDRSPLQVDTALALTSSTVSELVAAEAARAAELLLRMSPTPLGPPHLDAYRRMFEHRYGRHREVALLELLDPGTGLGPPPAATSSAGPAPPRSAERARVLLDLATTALRDRTLCVDLDDTTRMRLETDDLSASNVPLSLDLTVLVAAASRASLDAGDFELTIGPTIGSMAAGRMLGRFADFVPGAEAALRRIASSESARTPGRVMAELAYAPRSQRLANVSTRPNVRPYEIAIGVTSGLDPSRTIPVDELAVGIRDGRFCVRWAATGEEVVLTAGHMLSHARAPTVCKFLADVGRNGVCQLSGFQWGPASSFPFLPRVRSGRMILSLAQWRVESGAFVREALADLPLFHVALDEWRRKWDAPTRLAIAAGDHRLPLDLTRAGDADELRRVLRREAKPVILTEVFPETDGVWVTDVADRRFRTEFVVPLVRRVTSPAPAAVPARPTSPADLRPPGSEWLFLKLYTGHDMENDLLAGPVRELAEDTAARGFGEWFFIRYSDPGRHIRLRFHGDPGRLMSELLPLLSRWATGLMARGVCLRFAFDTYERELERFGGPAGAAAAEAMFVADSTAVVELLAFRLSRDVTLEPLAVAALTVDALLDGLGLDAVARGAWCGARAGPRQQSGADYRTWKATLRPILTHADTVRTRRDADALAVVLDRLRQAGARLGATLDDLQASGHLTCAPADLYGSVLHLHLNRSLAADQSTERRVFGLLSRLRSGLAASGLDRHPD